MTYASTIKAPFTDKQVEALNEYQRLGFLHEFTCSSVHCKRSERGDGGVLIATKDGWVCPCGKYKQDWAHEFMADIDKLKKRHFW